MPSFINKQTTLDLNGPILSFVQQPESASVCIGGSVSFIGVSTAIFPTQEPPNSTTGTGYISYRWYLDGYGPLSDGDLDNTIIAGSGTTTLTLSNISESIFKDNRIFLRADYIPSAYSISGSDVTAGTARSTGNALNDPIDSDFVFLNVLPNISVTKQPRIIGLGGTISTVTDNTSNEEVQPNIDFSTNSILRFPMRDLNTGNIILEDISFAENTIENNNVTWKSDGGKFYRGYAFFDGGQETYFNILPYSDFNFGAGDFTVECWVNFSKTGNLDIFSTGRYSNKQLSIRKNKSSSLTSSPGIEQLEVYYNTQIIASGGTFALNKWYHVAVTRNNGVLRLFIDGIQVASANFTNSISANEVRIGQVYSNAYPMVGGIQEFEVYNAAKYISNFNLPSVNIPKSNKPYSVSQGSIISFSAESDVSDNSSENISYQWQLNGVDLVDGENSFISPKNNLDYPSNAVLRLPLWDQNGGSIVLEDLTNVANTVTNNGVTWVSGGGKFYDGYAYFNGNAYLELNPISDFNFGTGDFTVECWVYFTQTGWNDIFATGSYTEDQLSIRKNSYSQLADSPGSEQLEVYYGSTIIASGGKFDLNTWHHVAVTRTTPFTSEKQNSTLRLFIDGVEVANAIFNDNIKSNTPCLIGRTSANPYPMVGRIQDFQVYSISKYTSNFSPSTVAIVDKRLSLSLPLWDNGTGTLSLIDLSPNSKKITPGSSWGSSPSWRTGIGKFYGGAAYFGGSSYLNVPGSSDFNFGFGDFTIELWVNFQSGSNPYPTGPWEVLVNVGGGYYSDGGIWFAMIRGGTAWTDFYIADTSGYRVIGQIYNIESQLNQWHHLAVSKDSSEVRFYYDGQLVRNPPRPVSDFSSQAFGGSNLGYIGMEHATFHDQGYYFPFCYMQDIQIYKGVAKYTSNFTPTETSIYNEKSENIEISTTVIGSQSPNLSLALSNISTNLIRAKITHPTACNSPIYTDTVQYNVVSQINRAILEVEAYYQDSTEATLREFDLTDLDYEISSDTIDSDTICLYAKERDFVVEMELYGAKGSDSKAGYVGGEGGYSKIRFTMRKGEEYILKGIKSKTALYLYRKAQLIACVAQGGSAGPDGNGGRGGGVGVSGENGFGPNSGQGAQIASLNGNGIFGSTSAATTIYAEDSKATGRLGGRTISCSKGVYWRDQGVPSCADLGISKFRLSDGREVANSIAISRGFKDGYVINQTAGLGLSGLGANGGNGATGGMGGDRGGGGGGSGYTDTSVIVVDAILGGNQSKQTKAILRFYENALGDFYVDSAGRILIFSAATVGKDPRTLTKTTGRVLPGTDSCIDDVRWQNFLDLALTQDYRLTATLDGGTTGVTRATSFNLRRMVNANEIVLKRSLTDWENTNYAYSFYALAWDETNVGGARGYGVDYSILSYAPGTYYYGYYGSSSNPFFSGSTYSHKTANYWILPPGVPDFP